MKIRSVEPDDVPAVLALLQESLGWLADEDHRRFYRWKHLENPFGPSSGWVAMDGDRLVGLRLFMRWEFRNGSDVMPAVRAVDTATHPDYRGRGIFRRLTLQAVEELEREGVGFVFNTPNEQSRPGYLKMGWRIVGRLPAMVRPRSPAVLGKLLRARVPADLASVPCAIGEPVGDVFNDGRVERALDAGDEPPGGVLATNRTGAYMRWRYGHRPLGYRALVPTGDACEGIVVFRLRRRGPATEAVVADLLGEPPRHPRLRRDTVRGLWQTGADYILALAGARGLPRSIPIRALGPVLTARPLAARPPDAVDAWNLSMGDIELF